MQGKYWMKLIVLRRWLDLVANSVHFISKGRMVLKIFTFIVLPFYLVTPVDSFLFLLLTSSLIGSVFFLSTNLPFLLISYSPPLFITTTLRDWWYKGWFQFCDLIQFSPKYIFTFPGALFFCVYLIMISRFYSTNDRVKFSKKVTPVTTLTTRENFGSLETVDPKNYN